MRKDSQLGAKFTSYWKKRIAKLCHLSGSLCITNYAYREALSAGGGESGISRFFTRRSRANFAIKSKAIINNA